MDTWPWWSLVAIVVAVVVAVASVLATRAWGTRRKRLDLAVEVFPLLSGRMVGNGATDLVTVSVNGREYDQPHGISVTLTNTGTTDVRPGDYAEEAGSLTMPGCAAVGPLRGELWTRGAKQSTNVGGGGRADPTRWDFDSVHIPRGAHITFSGVVDGRPSEVKLGPLYDVDVRMRVNGPAAWEARWMFWGLALVAVCVFPASVVILLTADEDPRWAVVALVLSLLVIGVVSGTALFALARAWRWGR